MKILLAAINAKYIHSNLAVYSLKAYAEQRLTRQAEITLCEYTINQDREKVLADMYMQKPQLLALSCYIWNITYIKALIPQIKELLPDTDIWLGGPEVSYHAQNLFSELPISGIMLGEGEKIFTNLLSCYLNCKESGQDKSVLSEQLKNVKGIACPGFQTEPETILAMDELPFVYAGLPPKQFENRIVYYESSRGCPFRCAYCLSAIDKQVRFRSVSLVKRELKFFLDRQVLQVKFVDRTFNCNKEHAMEIWTYILEHDNGITNFHFEIAADIMTEEELDLIRKMRPGLIQLEIGVQTTNADTIETINRQMDFSRVAAVVQKLQSGRNVHLHLDLIAGLPKEGYLSFQKSFNEVYALRPQQLQLGFLKVLKGTPIEAAVTEAELKYWSEPPYEVLSTKWLGFDKVLRLKEIEEMVEVYYNSGQFLHAMRFLEAYFAAPFALYEALAEYYRIKGYSTLQPSRLRKYEILLEFAEQIEEIQNKTCAEFLTLDLYLREKLKKRPGFSGEQESYKEKMRAFYKREEKSRTYLKEYAGLDYRQLMKLTHMERFEAIQGKEQFLLFDYRNKDALTAEATLIDITEEMKGKKP